MEERCLLRVVDDYQWFIRHFHSLTGIDLSLYKEEQMKRRLTTLRSKRNIQTFQEFYHAMLKSKPLYEECLDRVTINVTEFYRNRPRWDVLEQFIKEQFRDKQEIKVWSAACSTGEEPFSLATLLSRYFPLEGIQITATDIDLKVLEKAKEGNYIERTLNNLTDQEKSMFFNKNGLIYTVKDKYRPLITFQQHNLLSDPAPDSFDLIVCRNVLIYFKEDAKEIIYQKFGQALKSNGLLFVGSTEQIFHPEKFNLKPVKTFFYQKN
ncbi:methyltransferase [Terrilactibacillus sp. BCM23-1]|uniref:Methyltransferase n=1 Tax=Terrilactibacillus tamarindi TaxID=2599694 RepID=A0A6N8CQ95_9BACI|nr:protein-glutamate O-methyltransferase CheR [Terrilactibacillus tamarindi]MTT31273.1 methyltransferase [Terrilactibacillus tamarindi]